MIGQQFEIMELGEELNQNTNSQLRTILSQFRNQQQLMRTTVHIWIQAKKDKENNPPLCPNCVNLKKQLRDKTYKVSKLSNGSYTHLQDLDILDDTSLEGQICPMCKHVETEDDLFLSHVYSHFGESNEDDPCTGNTLEHATVFPQFNI
ncbi:uncharacterized protein LOC103512588 [Diaphorina citri]|uniref:Uncharacterized protein LOC103512588 n=1 Tax=Diaphorina citri TaxID=121845 RepID=A0A1S3D6P9_DIACI|nr:uncharacterized protein LOC103512588 [Diaphorina citri]